MKKGKDGFYAKYVKRILDIICAIVALIVLSPLMLVIAILVRINLGSPVLFRQERPGYHEKIFTMYKFRTMENAKNADGNSISDKERLELLKNKATYNDAAIDSNRIGKFGKTLRKLSLDELPELINILKGDLSVVGPRPLSILYLPYYSEKEHHRHDVRAGLSGLAQVNGRNSVSWEKRFEYDLEYVNNISFKEDFMILLKTFKTVFEHKDIGQADEKPIAFHVLRQQQDKATGREMHG